MPPIPVLLPFLILFFGTLVLMLAIVPLLSVLAKRVGLVDKPDDRRKLHSREVPLIGGIAILIAVLVSCGIVFLLAGLGVLDKTIVEFIEPEQYWQLGGLVFCALAIVAVGVLDDRFGIRGRQKLLAQLIVAVILVATGTWVQSLSLPDNTLQFGDAFTSNPKVQYAQLVSEMTQYQESETKKIVGDTTGELSEAQKTQIVDVRSRVKSIKRDTYIRLFIFNRMMALAAMVLTVIWIVGAINSVNLIDGADGLAGTTTLIVSLGLAVIALWTRHYVEAAIALSLSGALFGFLVFNFPPAKIFLGDAGSMLIGMVLASLAVQSYLKEPMIYICMAPLAMLFIPIFDSTIAFARRIATGRSIYSTDRGHLHHILLRHGLTDRGMVLFVGGLTTITAVGAAMTVIFNDSKFSVIGIATVIVFLISAKVFGFAEFKLLCTRFFRLCSSLVMPRRNKRAAQSVTFQLQGSQEWGKLWKTITDFAESHDFIGIKLDLNLPWLHESFHADWKKPTLSENEQVWQTRLPLAAKGRVYGRIEISGVVGKESIYVLLMLMSDLLENLEPALAKLAEGHTDSVEVPVLPKRRKDDFSRREEDPEQSAKNKHDRIAS